MWRVLSHGNMLMQSIINITGEMERIGQSQRLANGALLWDSARMHMTHDPAAPPAEPISFDAFLAVDIRVGTIVEAEPYREARKPAFKLVIDFGPAIGRKKSSAQIVANYEITELVGRQVAAVVNFPPRQIGKFMSEVLTLGFPDAAGEVVLFMPDKSVPDGARLF